MHQEDAVCIILEELNIVRVEKEGGWERVSARKSHRDKLNSGKRVGKSVNSTKQAFEGDHRP